MKLFNLLFLITILSFSLIFASKSTEVPNSPLGKRFTSWLDAFNSGEKEKFQEFLKYFKTPSEHDVERELHFSQMTGGFELKKIEKATSTELIGLIQEKDSDQFARFTIEIESEPSHLITKLDVNGINRPEEFKLERMTESQAIEALRKQIALQAERGKFSGSILIAKNGKPILIKATGFADYDKKISNRIDTKYNLGSMNKMFTAIAIAQLAQEHKLNFSDSITKYLPNYPNPEFAQVTIHHLLTHTGGTGDIFGPEYDVNIEKLKEPKDYISLYGNRSLEFQPGSKWSYSNYGFVLLGAIVENISGQSYYDYIEQHIFYPAGMCSSGSYWKTEETQNLAIGYSLTEASLKHNYDFLPMRGSPAGGGYSTVEDLFKFATSLLDNKLLNTEYTNLVTTGKIDLQETEKYAYGFFDQLDNGIRRFGHSGGAPGINSTLRIYPTSGYVVVVMGNFDPSAADRIADFIGLRLPEK